MEKILWKNYGEAIDVTNEGLPEEGMFAFPNSVSTDAATESSEGLEPTFGPYTAGITTKNSDIRRWKIWMIFWMCWRVCRSWRVRKKAARTSMQFSLFKDWDDNMMNNAKQPACMYGYDEVGFVLSKADGTEEQSILDDDFDLYGRT